MTSITFSPFSTRLQTQDSQRDRRSDPRPPGVNFTNMFTNSFYICCSTSISPKCMHCLKPNWRHLDFFALHFMPNN